MIHLLRAMSKNIIYRFQQDDSAVAISKKMMQLSSIMATQHVTTTCYNIITTHRVPADNVHSLGELPNKALGANALHSVLCDLGSHLKGGPSRTQGGQALEDVPVSHLMDLLHGFIGTGGVWEGSGCPPDGLGHPGIMPRRKGGPSWGFVSCIKHVTTMLLTSEAGQLCLMVTHGLFTGCSNTVCRKSLLWVQNNRQDVQGFAHTRKYDSTVGISIYLHHSLRTSM